MIQPRVAAAALTGALLTVPHSLWAHPGHGTTDPQSLVHHTTEWVHAGPWWMALAATAAAVGLLWRLTRQMA